MWEKLLGSIKDFILAGELTRQNTADVRELRKRNEELNLLVERLAFEIQRVRENEAHEREKLLLRLELDSKPKKKLPPKKGTK
ncbi:MAG: hypothetical protein KF685_12165 [Acidobacteria bacterium]|nr:hypothetical protein [Acidobacteriota bacterium]